VPIQIETGPIHHLRLTVTDITRSREFYTSLLGFDVAVDSPPDDDPAAEAAKTVLWGGCVMVRGNLLLGLRPVAPKGDASMRTGSGSTTSASTWPAAMSSTAR
jgi:catechol 2,3-dioxygenase-like lactoylglutathione lyase family enzyme